jgi:CDP-4-dehydro-6-deoxyglucose reductase
MSHRVTLHPGGQQFDCPTDKPILSAALAANILISYGCRQGQCGSCRGRVIKGSIEYPNGFPDAITEYDAGAGYALFCSAYAKSDVTIEIGKSINLGG